MHTGGKMNALAEKLKNANIAKIARETGLHINTIYIVRDNKGNPTSKTLEKLERYFNDK
jgi:DNA-binding phage protein